MRDERERASAGTPPSTSRDFVSYSTHAIATPRKVEFWNEHASEIITSLHVEPSVEIPFDASLNASQFGGIGFIRAISTPARVVHSHPPDRQQDAPPYLIHLQCQGTCINRQANREVLLEAGDFVLCDNSLPCELMLGGEQNDMLVLRIPPPLLERRMPTPQAHINKHMRGDRSSSQLASRFVRMFWEQCQLGVSPLIADRLADSVCDLLSTAFLESGGPALDPSSVQTLWKLRIRHFIDRHLADPRLTVSLIASHFRISPRYVHKLYACEAEAISKYILRRRLEACHRSLTDLTQSAKTVLTIALEWGFNNTTHFARVFRQRYGMSPSELRQRVQESGRRG